MFHSTSPTRKKKTFSCSSSDREASTEFSLFSFCLFCKARAGLFLEGWLTWKQHHRGRARAPRAMPLWPGAAGKSHCSVCLCRPRLLRGDMAGAVTGRALCFKKLRTPKRASEAWGFSSNAAVVEISQPSTCPRTPLSNPPPAAPA